MENEVQVLETSTTAGMSNGAKVGLVIAASVLTAGVAYGVIRLIRSRKAKKAAVTTEEVSK